MPCVNALQCTTMSLSSCPSSSSLRVRASFDTQQRLSYNPNAPKNPKKALASTAKPPPPPPPLTGGGVQPNVNPGGSANHPQLTEAQIAANYEIGK
ncbi:hypothetical protein Q3G72_008422 [Acer saccharum]|nr:hypothetical protein Q3G72_008422 [Acer saccharum]